MSANAGVVTLRGNVSTLVEKYAAENSTSRVKGVRAIANEIAVHPRIGPDLGDAAIARRVADIVAWDDSLPKDAVQVHVSSGRVTLEGEVKWHFQRKHAEDILSRLQGVQLILNHLTIKPVAYQADVATRIKDAFRRHSDLEARSIHVIVQGGTVTLQGDVKAWHVRDMARKAAWAASGVTDVIDQIVVAG